MRRFSLLRLFSYLPLTAIASAAAVLVRDGGGGERRPRLSQCLRGGGGQRPPDGVGDEDAGGHQGGQASDYESDEELLDLLHDEYHVPHADVRVWR